MNDNENLNDDVPYIQIRTEKSKVIMGIVVLIIGILLFFVFKFKIIDDSITGEQLKSSMELFDIRSYWVKVRDVDEPDYRGVIIAPEINFRIRNIGKINLSYVRLIGVFRFLTGKRIGEGYKVALHKELKPGEESKVITLNPGFGYRAHSIKSFEEHPRSILGSFVEIFAQSKNSKMIFIKSFYISRRIKGERLKVKILGKEVK